MSLRLALLAICSVVITFGWKCGGARDEIVYGPVHERHLMTRSSNLSPIRLTPYYLDFDLGTTELNDNFKNTLYPSVENFFKTRLKVYSVQKNLIVGSYCQGYTLPKDHQTYGVADSDVLIYFKTEFKPYTGYIAYAGACYIDTSSRDNVYAGIVMINFYYFSLAPFATQYSVLIHEIYHLLGFSNSLYQYWKDQNGIAYTAPTQTTTVRGFTKVVLKTPNVVAKAKEAFGCSTLTGIELEDYGISGTAYTKFYGSSGATASHWDKRIMFNDFMIATDNQDPIYSTISLALLKDTGWYEVDYSKADIPFFGRGAGCSFFENKCLTNGVSNFPSLFCDLSMMDICDTFNIRKGFCSITSYMSALPTAGQYFTSSTTGGDPYADFCPIRLSSLNGNCRAINASDTLTYSDGYETIGPNSHCFESTLSDKYSYSSGTRCYEVISCSTTGATVKIGSTTFSCPFTGGSISVTGFQGKVKCPASKILCEDFPCVYSCGGYGVCTNGVCICDSGYSGNSCQYKCDSTCSICTQTTCTTCKDPNAVATGLTCLCKTGFTLSASGLCTATVPSCNVLCTVCTSGVCSACTSNSFLYNGSCICASGYVINGASCTSCGFSCTSCSTTACLTCAAGSVLSNGSCACLAGYVNSNLSCVACPTNCDVCSSSSVCTTCKSNYYITSTGSCKACSSYCMQCNSVGCTSCATGYTLNNGACVISCIANCKSCMTSGICSICDTEYFLISNTCVPCIPGCLTCSSFTSCTTCKTGFSLLSTGTCGISCSSYCISCDYNSGKCITCKAGYYPDANSLCVICPTGCTACSSSKCTTCSKGYALSDGTCKIQCPTNCATCSSSTICTTCNTGYKVTSTGSCAVPCPKNCSACSSAGSCTTCNSGYFISSGKCSACSKSCVTCSSSTSCTTCNAGYYLTTSKACTVCAVKNCNKCTSKACTSCKSGFTLKSGKCV